MLVVVLCGGYLRRCARLLNLVQKGELCFGGIRILRGRRRENSGKIRRRVLGVIAGVGGLDVRSSRCLSKKCGTEKESGSEYGAARIHSAVILNNVIEMTINGDGYASKIN